MFLQGLLLCIIPGPKCDTSVRPPHNFLLHSVIMDRGKLKSMSLGCPPLEHDTHQILQKYINWLSSSNGRGEMEAHAYVQTHVHRQHNDLRIRFLHC
jgi:hypothetical protein